MCSAVGIVRGYGLDGPGRDYRQEQEPFVKTFTQALVTSSALVEETNLLFNKMRS